MGSNCFEVDTGYLRENTSGLRQDLDSVTALCGQLSDTMTRLFGMWEGAAKDAFHLQFSNDCAAFTQTCKQLEEIIESMEHAASEYDACDSKVRGIVDAISISDLEEAQWTSTGLAPHQRH